MGRKTNRVLLTTKEDIKNINPNNLELIDDFLNYMETTDHSPHSIVVYRSSLNIFFVWLMKYSKNKDFVDIKKRDIMNFQNFLIKKGLSPARIRVLRSAVSSLSNFIEAILDEEEKWENFRNIVNKIPAPNLNPVREKTIISDEELDFLLEELVKRNKIQIATFVAFCAFSGARKAEMLEYKMTFFTDDSLKNGLYVTPEIRCKGMGVEGKLLPKYVIKNKVEKYLDLWKEERKQMNVDIDDMFVIRKETGFRPATMSATTGWMKICSDILQKDVYVHSFRHFFISSLYRQNVPINVIKDIVGHNDVSTTEIYNDNPKEDGFLKYFSDEGIVDIKTNSLSDL